VTVATGGTSVAIFRSMNSLKHVTCMAAHAAALIFGAFWLVATSAPSEPVRDCFTGIANPTRLQVVLGPLEVPDTNMPGCGAIDGLSPGGTLVFYLSQGPRPEGDRDTCYGFATDSLTGLTGVAQLREGRTNGSSLTAVEGDFTPAECRVSWFLRLFPVSSPPEGELISPLDAGSQQRWIVHRSMVPNRTPCGTTGFVACSDRFAVASITELAAP